MHSIPTTLLRTHTVPICCTGSGIRDSLRISVPVRNETHAFHRQYLQCRRERSTNGRGIRSSLHQLPFQSLELSPQGLQRLKFMDKSKTLQRSIPPYIFRHLGLKCRIATIIILSQLRNFLHVYISQKHSPLCKLCRTVLVWILKISCNFGNFWFY